MGSSMYMGMYQMGTPQNNYLTQTKPGDNPYGMVQNNYGGYAPTYDLPMPNPYYEANITPYPSNYAPTYAPTSYTPNYDVQLTYPPVYNHPGYQAPYISIPTAPPIYMPANPPVPLPYQIPPPPQIEAPPVATPLAYAPTIAKPLDFGYPPPTQQAPYVNTPQAPYGPTRPGTPVYPPQPPAYYQNQGTPNYYPLQQSPNYAGAYPQTNYQAPYQPQIPNYGIPYSFAQQGYAQPQQYVGNQQPSNNSYRSGITSY
jgi:hypothetical protein